MAFITGPALSCTRGTKVASTCNVHMSTESEKPVSRRALLAAAAATVTVSLLPKNALADREYANVGFLGGGDVIDVNNANVRVYQKLQGFYPGLAGLVVSNGPYESVDDLYNLPGITEDQIKVLDRCKKNLVALKPAPEYVIDKINNGLYR